jgi:iron-sulfur cluster assembly accessory protein
MIHRQMTIDEIFSLYPAKAQKLAQEMTNAGLHCVGCSAATYETVEAGMASHGMSDATIDALLARLNAILAEKEDLTTITLTPRAAEKYLQILNAEQKGNWALRFGERAAGCSGFEYFLDYSEQAGSDDVVYTSSGVDIHVKKSSIGRLLGSVIDYVDGLQGAGFKITNPNVKHSCGCGTSHGY